MAGIPATVLHGGTSFSTTEPAAIREQLPTDFQTAEYLLEHGMVDMVVDRRELRERLAGIIDLLRRPGPAAQILKMDKKREEMAAKASEAEKKAEPKAEKPEPDAEKPEPEPKT